MKKASQEQSYDNDIEQKLQQAFGYSDEQLLAEYSRAEAQPNDPELIPPKDEWRKLLERVNIAEEKKATEHKVLRLKNVARPLIMVAALGMVLMATGIGVSGKRGFEYLVTRQGGVGSNLIWDNNEDNLARPKAEDEAYQKIEDELGIDVVRVDYLPKDFVFKELKILNSHAKMTFLNNGEYMQLLQTLFAVENSGSSKADGSSYKTIHNEWLKLNFSIEKNELDGNKTEFTATAKNAKARYYVSAIMEEEVFIKVIENLKYFEK